MTTTPPAPPATGLRARAGSAVQKVPTKWFVSGGLVVFLAVSAAFGGLNDAVAAPIPELAAGDTHTGAQLSITVERAVLLDGFPEQGILPDEGDRLLVVVATVEDVWHDPASTRNTLGAADNLRPVGVQGLDAASMPLSVAVISDGSEFPDLQPGVPIELAFIWSVDPAALAEGDAIAVDLYDKTYRSDGFITSGERWVDPVVAATVTVPVTDSGDGSGADTGEGEG
ncbi:hypothetical protein [Herbiconiux sp. YIM B11900]|uniref:hypothetical protein n=1 Tax=Herbiconiux sp. YIM B11900 TaxID=3404131 RepID=UPI003F842562